MCIRDSSWVATDPEFWPVVRRLRAFRGIDTLSALIIVLEVADFTRFPRAVQLGSWLGLVPSRQQSGETRCARVDHQDRLAVRPADPGRGRLALGPPARPRPGSAGRTASRSW